MITRSKRGSEEELRKNNRTMKTNIKEKLRKRKISTKVKKKKLTIKDEQLDQQNSKNKPRPYLKVMVRNASLFVVGSYVFEQLHQDRHIIQVVDQGGDSH